MTRLLIYKIIYLLKESITNKLMTKFTKDFDSWNSFKKSLELLPQSPLYDPKTDRFLYKEGEIWFCSIGINVGNEICGKNANFERPVLILRKSKRLFVCLSLTSQIPKNPQLYYDISYFDSVSNIQINSYVALTAPMTYDVLRLSRKVRKLRDIHFLEIKEKASKYLKGEKL